MPSSRPIPLAVIALDSRSRAYMFGHQAMTKQELRAAMEDAQADEELKGTLRNLVLERFRIRIGGGEF